MVSLKRQNFVTIHEDGAGSGRSHKQEQPSVAMNVLRMNVCEHKIQISSPKTDLKKQGKKKKITSTSTEMKTLDSD